MAAQGKVQERTLTKIVEPKRYNVVMHNDDFTTMEFVVSILEDIFHKPSSEANRLMLQVHRAGSAVVGNYSFDIATSKVNAAMNRARQEGFPFRMTVEEA